ncbi:hypothetical protein BWI75_08145 [Gloeocapsopsis sp. AAB1 = 1H9]|uniref:Uncharacterized protein n=1 Tax=Gloeocapsopsis dulcis AAB1 = 1H9 TaxID=1433147 RepID=A0A6N8FVX7_9CHRO|nr:hypothetical protein [Gloeocapsopsis dulcis AAB1 = 1H9]
MAWIVLKTYFILAQGISMYPFNICSSALARFPLGEVIDIATQSGLKRIELKVHPQGHKSIYSCQECDLEFQPYQSILELVSYPSWVFELV